jgi:penicillin-binding protein 2
MFRHSEDRSRGPIPAQMSVRVAVLGGVALAMFSIIFFRLWYLQVLSSGQYRAEAENNQVRDITVQAPRGRILDRSGHVLVDNRTALALQVRPLELPNGPGRRGKELGRLAQITNMPYHRIRKEINDSQKLLPASPVTLRRDVTDDLVYYLRENQHDFPGISIDRVYVRGYPKGDEAAQVVGYVGQVSPDELKAPQFQSAVPGDTVGKSGVESEYDSVLRGINGSTRVQVDAAGQPTGGTLSQRAPRAGDDLRLSIDSKVQQAGEDAIGSFLHPGAFVAMNIHNGEVLGLGSTPTFFPEALAKPRISNATFNSIFGDPNDPASSVSAPFFNRAIAGGYPVGSTMKPITTVAGLESGTINTNTVINDTGQFDLGDGRVIYNAGGGPTNPLGFGPIDLSDALTRSDDYYFYDVGYKLDQQTGNDTHTGPLQKWASELGLGSTTGIDLPGEGGGLVPSPEWRNKLYQQATSPDSPGGRSAVYPQETDRPWTVGDSVNLAVGQGDLQADPLQMAVAYATIANGGDVVRPHVGLSVADPQGRVTQEINPALQRHVDIKPEYRSLILDAIHNAAQRPDGTSYGVFGNYPVGVAGKTGTAQRTGQQDQSWYVVLAPYPNPKVVVAATIEQGGFGADAAAPAARLILNAYFSERDPHFAKQLANAAPITSGSASATTANPYG